MGKVCFIHAEILATRIDESFSVGTILDFFCNCWTRIDESFSVGTILDFFCNCWTHQKFQKCLLDSSK